MSLDKCWSAAAQSQFAESGEGIWWGLFIFLGVGGVILNIYFILSPGLQGSL